MSSVNPTSDLPPPILPPETSSSNQTTTTVPKSVTTQLEKRTSGDRESVRALRERHTVAANRNLFESPSKDTTSSTQKQPVQKSGSAVLFDSGEVDLESALLSTSQHDSDEEDYSDSDSSTSSAEVRTPPRQPETPTTSKKCDWLKVASIIIGVIGLLFATFGALCAANVFPGALLGGELGVGCAIAGGAVVMGTGAMLFYHNYRQKQVADLPLST